MMTLGVVIGVVLGLAWGSAERLDAVGRVRSRMLRRLRQARRQRDAWRERHAELWRAGATALSKRNQVTEDWRDAFNADEQEGE